MLIILVLLQVVEWVIVLVRWSYFSIYKFRFWFSFSSMRNHQNNEILIIIVIDQTSLLAFGLHRPPLPFPNQLCHSLLWVRLFKGLHHFYWSHFHHQLHQPVLRPSWSVQHNCDHGRTTRVQNNHPHHRHHHLDDQISIFIIILYPGLLVHRIMGIIIPIIVIITLLIKSSSLSIFNIQDYSCTEEWDPSLPVVSHFLTDCSHVFEVSGAPSMSSTSTI